MNTVDRQTEIVGNQQQQQQQSTMMASAIRGAVRLVPQGKGPKGNKGIMTKDAYEKERVQTVQWASSFDNKNGNSTMTTGNWINSDSEKQGQGAKCTPMKASATVGDQKTRRILEEVPPSRFDDLNEAIQSKASDRKNRSPCNYHGWDMQELCEVCQIVNGDNYWDDFHCCNADLDDDIERPPPINFKHPWSWYGRHVTFSTKDWWYYYDDNQVISRQEERKEQQVSGAHWRKQQAEKIRQQKQYKQLKQRQPIISRSDYESYCRRQKIKNNQEQTRQKKKQRRGVKRQEHRSVVKLQAVARGYITRKRQQMMSLEIKSTQLHILTQEERKAFCEHVRLAKAKDKKRQKQRKQQSLRREREKMGFSGMISLVRVQALARGFITRRSFWRSLETKALVRIQAIARRFITRRNLKVQFGVRFSACDCLWLPTIGFCFHIKRHQKEISGQQWRQQQELQQQLYGTVIKDTTWPAARKVTFTMTKTVYYDDGLCQIVHMTNPDTTCKDWRVRNFKPKQKRVWEHDEIIIRDCQTAARRQELRELRLQEQHQYRQQVQQIIHEGHQKMERQRKQYKEALQFVAEEVRRQLDAKGRNGKQKRKKMKKRKQLPQFDNQDQVPRKRVKLVQGNVFLTDPTSQVISIVIVTHHGHQSITVPLHRKAVRKKTPLTTQYLKLQSQHSAQSTPIHRKALRQQPIETISQNPAQSTPIHRRALRQQPIGRGYLHYSFSSSLHPLPWQHQAWISPTHRKTLRQQPFLG